MRYEGEIRTAGRAYAKSDQRHRARSVAYVPQRPVLPRSMSVTDYVLLGRSAHHTYLGAETARDRRVTATVLERLQLSTFSKRPLGELSGGESQRVVLARALVQEAPVLVMDEPTTSLDLGHSQLVLELADELRREKGLCVLCAIHDLTLAAQYSERCSCSPTAAQCCRDLQLRCSPKRTSGASSKPRSRSWTALPAPQSHPYGAKASQTRHESKVRA